MTSVEDSAQAFGDVLGGCLLDDTTIGAVPRSGWVTLYVADGDVSTLPDNPRATAVAARLGLIEARLGLIDQLHTRIRGSALSTGLDPDASVDTDVPLAVLAAARRLGLAIIVTGLRR